jgi:Na+/H+ antiporter NhaD/arsenite permease-like protein
LDIDPIPFFFTEVLASNVGGTATLIGDPPNIMIGSAANISFLDFILYDGPAVVIIMIVCIIVFKILYGRKLAVPQEKRDAVMGLNANDAIHDRSLFIKSVVMIILIAVAFVCHGALELEPSVIALTGAAIMLIISGADMEKVIHDVEWTTIGFFAGLFIVVGGLEHTGVLEVIAAFISNICGTNYMLMVGIIIWLSAIASAFIDNIPFAATMVPVIKTLADTTGISIDTLAWSLAIGTDVGGSATPIGASANVVGTAAAAKAGHPISWGRYCKKMVPATLIVLVIATVYICVVYL